MSALCRIENRPEELQLHTVFVEEESDGSVYFILLIPHDRQRNYTFLQLIFSVLLMRTKLVLVFIYTSITYIRPLSNGQINNIDLENMIVSDR